MKTKFKKGDTVSIKDNLAIVGTVINVFKEQYPSPFGRIGRIVREKVVLDNKKVYDANQLTFFSEPITRLQIAINSLVATNSIFVTKIQSMFDSKLAGVYRRLEKLENFVANQALEEVKTKKGKK